MRKSFIKKSPNAFFVGKKAKVLNDIENLRGDIIKANTIVIITGKNQRDKLRLNIEQLDVRISNVDPEDLELLKESDTLDLREHNFN